MEIGTYVWARTLFSCKAVNHKLTNLTLTHRLLDLCNCVVIILNYIFRYVNVLIVQCHPMKIVLISKYMYILRLTADVISSSPVANTFKIACNSCYHFNYFVSTWFVGEWTSWQMWPTDQWNPVSWVLSEDLIHQSIFSVDTIPYHRPVSIGNVWFEIYIVYIYPCLLKYWNNFRI
jgi:hypothetical protein